MWMVALEKNSWYRSILSYTYYGVWFSPPFVPIKYFHLFTLFIVEKYKNRLSMIDKYEHEYIHILLSKKIIIIIIIIIIILLSQILWKKSYISGIQRTTINLYARGIVQTV